MKQSILWLLAALFSTAVFSAQSAAQTKGDTYAIKNARIITVSGPVIQSGTIVIRDGLIESVGASVTAPADARILDGSGLTVYPGFFDSYTSLGLPTAAGPTGGRQPQGVGTGTQTVFSNSNYPIGLQPEISAIDTLKAGDPQFEAARNAGFTTALTVGRDGVFNGRSALIDLTGDNVSAMIIKAPYAEHVTFRTLGNVYPTALLGTFSALRQMLLDAGRLQKIKKMYDANPGGMKRPAADASLEALIPVLNRSLPIVFNANSEREIVRALDLAREFNLLAVIAGGQEAWKQAARLKAQNVPVLLSLNFPKRTATASPEADPETLETLRLRAEVPKNAAILDRAGVRFAFQSGAMQNINDFFSNAEKAVAAGLPGDAAVRAITLSPAEIFGVDNRMGSIEPGKIANLVVTRGEIFSKDTSITEVFVDGRLYEQKYKPKTIGAGTGSTSANAINLSGSWKLTATEQGQTIPLTLNLTQQSTTLTGSLESELFGSTSIRNGTVTNDTFRFEATTSVGGQNIEVTFVGKVNGSQMSGTATIPDGPIPFSGSKVP
jgi:imidazolonepropionase-like amidohydrolase